MNVYYTLSEWDIPHSFDDCRRIDAPSNLHESSSLLKEVKGTRSEKNKRTVFSNPYNLPSNDPNFMPKAIHRSYDYLVSCVNRTIEVAASIVYDTHENWLKFKNSNTATYIEEMEKLDKEEFKNSDWICEMSRLTATEKNQKEIHDVRTKANPPKENVVEPIDDHYNESFKRFMYSYLGNDKAYGDPAAILNFDGYIRGVALLRRELMQNSGEYNYYYTEFPGDTPVTFDIENCPEFINSVYSTSRSGNACFKIKPMLGGFERFMDMDTTSVKPWVTLKVCYDIRTIINDIIENVDFLRYREDANVDDVIEDEPVAADRDPVVDVVPLTREEYIQKVLKEYSSLPEEAAKLMCVEMLETCARVEVGFPKFMGKINKYFMKAHLNPDISRYDAIYARLKKELADGTGIMDRNTRTKAFVPEISLIDRMISDISTKEWSSNRYRLNVNNFVSNILSGATGLKWDWNDVAENNLDTNMFDKKIIEIVIPVFSKAFTHFFEMAVSYACPVKYYEKKWKHTSYREFDQEVDYELINNMVSRIECPDTKDFFRTNIAAMAKRYRVVPFDNRKYQNGEKFSYRYSSTRRKIWIRFLCDFTVLMKCAFEVQNLYNNHKHFVAMDAKMAADYADQSTNYSRAYKSYKAVLDSLAKLVQDNFLDLLEVLANIGNACGVPLMPRRYLNMSYNRRENFVCVDLVSMFRLLNRYVMRQDKVYAKWHHNQHNRLSAWISSQPMMTNYMGDHLIMSFDSNDLPREGNEEEYLTASTHDLISKVFRGALVESGLLDVEYGPHN